MVSIGLLVVMFLLLPFAIRAATKKRDGGRGVRWHGIQWQRDELDESDAALARGVARQKAGDLAGALAEYDAALALRRTAKALNNRGCARLEAGELDLSLEDLREAVSIDPEDATAHCSLAEALAKTGDHAAAALALERACALDASWRDYAKTASAFAGFRDSTEGKRWLGE